MTNLVKFPRRGRTPPTPAPTFDELKVLALEIELAQAQIAQIRSATRQANMYWTWYSSKRVIIWGFVIWLLLTAFAKRRPLHLHRPWAGSTVHTRNAPIRRAAPPAL